MPPFLYRCPNTGYRVQGLVAEDVSEDAESYEAVTCTACQRVHLVNPTSGKVGLAIGADDFDARGRSPNVLSKKSVHR